MGAVMDIMKTVQRQDFSPVTIHVYILNIHLQLQYFGCQWYVHLISLQLNSITRSRNNFKFNKKNSTAMFGMLQLEASP